MMTNFQRQFLIEATFLHNSRFLKKQFRNADKNKSGCLTLDECKSLVEQLNIKMDKDTLKDLFNVIVKWPTYYFTLV